MAHSLEPAPQQPRPRPRNGIRGLAAIARTHPRRAMMDVVHISLVLARTHPRRAMMDVVHISLVHATMSVDEDRFYFYFIGIQLSNSSCGWLENCAVAHCRELQWPNAQTKW